MSLRFHSLLIAGLLSAPAAYAQQVGAASEEDEIVVTGQRVLPGSIPGNISPEITLGPGEVRSLGASTVTEVLAAIATQTGSASGRGGGRPIVLLNGRRISSFQEIRDIPAEAIARVEVFDEQASLQYGFSPDQRVVNVVLRGRYRVSTAETVFGAAAEGARDIGRADLSRVEIDRGSRTSVSGGYDASGAITENERGIDAPSTGADERAFRSLAPDETNWRAAASFARPLDERVALSANARVDSNAQDSLLGLDTSGNALIRSRETQTLAGGAALDGNHAGWQWTVTGAGELVGQTSNTSSGAIAAERTRTSRRTLDLTANANGAAFELPTGDVRVNARANISDQAIDSRSSSARSDLSRGITGARFGFSAPLTSTRREVLESLGDFSINASAFWNDLSDFGALSGHGAGLSWSPTSTIRFSAQSEISQAAPTLQQLGDPVEITPDVVVFDYATGANASVTRTSGGNAALAAEDRDDLSFNANWSPASVEGLTLNLGWARNESENTAIAFPLNLPEAEAAFATRFTRDSGGALTAVDARPINLARRETEFVRIALNYTRGFGPQIQPTPGSPPWGQGLPPWGSGPPPWGSGPPPQFPQGGAGGGGPGGGGFFGGGGGGARGFRPGRWNISLAYRQRLADEIVLVSGLPAIDLLDRGGLDAGGEPAGVLEFETGLTYRGMGVRFNGTWSDGYEIPVLTTGDTLNFSDRATLNMRAFVNFDQRTNLLAAAPWLRGGRLTLSVDNLTDSAVDVRDGAGETPAIYQEGYLSPLGRVVQLSIRKQF